MPEDVGGMHPISPEEKALLKSDYARGADLFQKSLAEYEKTTEENKKVKFKQVLDEASQVMNETAQLCLSKKGQKLEKVLERDYNEFTANSSPELMEKLHKDIAEIQKRL